MANRISIMGFEKNDFLGTSPSSGDITIDAVAARSGNYGLRVNGTSGAVTSWQYTHRVSGAGIGAVFMRFYMYIVSLPSTRRYFWRDGNATASATRLELGLNPDGSIFMGANAGAVSYGTSASTLSPGQWYRMEVGIDWTGNFRALRINGAMDIDWIAGPSSAVNTNVFFGALDTVAATMEYYIDDIASDIEDWPGYGRIELIEATTLASDNANWTLAAGASKLGAITEAAADGDTSYILSPANATDEIIFQFDTVPAASVVPRAVQLWIYGKGNAVSSSLQLRYRLYGTNAYVVTALGGALTFASASYSWQSQGFVNPTGTSSRLSASPIASQWKNEDADNIYVGLQNAATNQVRVSNMFIELEYDDKASAVVDPERQALLDFELALTSEIAWIANSLTSGSAAVSTTQAKWGSSALRINPGNGAQGYLQVALNAVVGIATVNRSSGCVGFWIYVAARPTSGSIDIWGIHQNVTRGMYIKMDSSGGIAYDTTVNGTGTFSAADTIPLNTWTFVQIEYRQASAATTATDAILRVWIDGTLVIDEDALSEGAITLPLMRFGTASNASGGCDIYYDGAILDAAYSMPERDHELETLVPDAAGSFTEAGFTVVGPANKYEALDELPGAADDDTSYVLTSGTATQRESYNFTTIPANTRRVFVVFYHAVFKRDGGTNGAIIWGPLVDGSITLRATTGSTTAYVLTNSGLMQRRPRRSRWDLTRINSIEFEFVENSVNKTRITRAAFVVEFSTLGEYGQRPSSYNQIVG